MTGCKKRPDRLRRVGTNDVPHRAGMVEFNRLYLYTLPILCLGHDTELSVGREGELRLSRLSPQYDTYRSCDMGSWWWAPAAESVQAPAGRGKVSSPSRKGPPK